ncbi:hypothetical protein BG000_011138 [Podila horticola]|nr:hypothetical protein BG000_011138 [Podila horticola]
MEESDQTTARRYQGFRFGRELVRIEAFQHPRSSNLVVFWSDINDCFPGVLRVQHDDLYVPFIRGQDMYRLKPHAIRFHPDTTLNIIYKTKSHIPQQQQHHMEWSHHHDSFNRSILSRSNTPHSKSEDITPHTPLTPTVSSENSDDIKPRSPSVASIQYLSERENFSSPLSLVTSSSSMFELRSSSTTPEPAQLNDPLTSTSIEGELSQMVSQTAPKKSFPMSSAQFRAFMGKIDNKGSKNSKETSTFTCNGQQEKRLRSQGSDMVTCYVGIVMAALFNRTMDMFMLERMDSIEYGFPDGHCHTHSPVHLGSDACLAACSRVSTTKAMKVALYMTDSFKAATLIRRALQGVPICPRSGCKRETTQIQSNQVLSGGPQAHGQRVQLGHQLDVREAIKANKHLNKLKLTIPDDEDPCQIFESFKALIANHAAMKTLAIHQTHLQQTHQIRKMPSSYTWKNVPSKRKDLELSTSFTTGDKVVPLIQKFTSCLTEVEIKDLSQADSFVLEKAFPT